MTTQETPVWGIHGGKTGDANTLFTQQNSVALGWDEIGDLTTLAPSRDAFKEAVAGAYPDKKPGAIPVDAGQLFRFVHEMQTGDLIAYPSKQDRQIHVGRITSDYKNEAGAPSYSHRRSVEWLAAVPRTHFSQGALYEIGSAMSFFLLKNYADEFRAAAEGEKLVLVAEGEDETVGLVAEEIEQTTRDFILKELAKELKGHPLAEFIAHLLNAMGYRTRVSPEGPDAGIDVIAHRDELGFEPPIVKVQVKSTEGSVGDPVVSQLYGKVGDREFGLFVTLGTFTNQARAFERGKSNLRLIDGDQLVDLVIQHYESFDSRYKGLLPLKSVYVPQPISESGS